MICGNPEMVTGHARNARARGMKKHRRRAEPGHIAVE